MRQCAAYILIEHWAELFHHPSTPIAIDLTARRLGSLRIRCFDIG